MISRLPQFKHSHSDFFPQLQHIWLQSLLNTKMISLRLLPGQQPHQVRSGIILGESAILILLGLKKCTTQAAMIIPSHYVMIIAYQPCADLAQCFPFIIIMFLFRERQYPKASEIHKETERKTKYKFLSYAPREELEKLSLAQVEFLYDIARYMPKPSNLARSSDVALYLLVMRKWQIEREEELRKNGIEPEPRKEEVSLFSKFTSKIAGFFKPSKENNNSLIDDNISTPLRQLTQ